MALFDFFKNLLFGAKAVSDGTTSQEAPAAKEMEATPEAPQPAEQPMEAPAPEPMSEAAPAPEENTPPTQ